MRKQGLNKAARGTLSRPKTSESEDVSDASSSSWNSNAHQIKTSSVVRDLHFFFKVEDERLQPKIGLLATCGPLNWQEI